MILKPHVASDLSITFSKSSSQIYTSRECQCYHAQLQNLVVHFQNIQLKQEGVGHMMEGSVTPGTTDHSAHKYTGKLCKSDGVNGLNMDKETQVWSSSICTAY